MTLTQVSTWFANARRRLKKENKWCPDGSGDDNNSENNDVTTEGTISPVSPTGQPQRLLSAQDESGYSSSDRSDRDSGSPPVTIPIAPPASITAGLPAYPHLMPHMLPLQRTLTASTATTAHRISPPTSPATAPTPVTSVEATLPRFCPPQPSVITVQATTVNKTKRQARQLWSISDITGESNEDVDVTA